MDTRIKYKFCMTSHDVADALSDLGFKLDSKKEQIPPVIKSFVSPSKLTQWSGWQLTPESIEHTLKYCIDKLALKAQIFVIHKGKLHTLIHIKPKFTAEEYLPRLKNLNKNLKWPHNFWYGDNIEFDVDENFYQNKNKDIRFLNCIIKPLYTKDENEDSDVKLNERTEPTYYGKLLMEVNEHYDLPDGIFYMTATDNLVLRDDRKEPWVDVVGGKVNLYSHDYPTHIPILNCSTAKHYRDIPLPTFDDWDYVSENKPDLSKVELNWKNKKPIAVFRGGSTGCGFTVKSNPRIKAAILSKKFPHLLDAKITGMGNKIKIHEYEGVGYNLPKFFGFKDLKKNFMSRELQSEHKYIVHIDGNVAAYRLGITLLFNAVILLVDSGSRLWFQDMMKPYVHYVPVKADLSDLIDKIKWCKSHDKECEIIANNAYELGKQVMTKKACIDYIAATFWKLTNL